MRALNYFFVIFAMLICTRNYYIVRPVYKTATSCAQCRVSGDVIGNCESE